MGIDYLDIIMLSINGKGWDIWEEVGGLWGLMGGGLCEVRGLCEEVGRVGGKLHFGTQDVEVISTRAQLWRFGCGVMGLTRGWAAVGWGVAVNRVTGLFCCWQKLESLPTVW